MSPGTGWPGTLTLALLTCGAPVVVCAADGETSGGEAAEFANTVTAGGYYSRGDYGAQRDTHVTYLPLSWEHRRAPWRFSVTVPWLKITGPGNVLVNTGGVGRDTIETRQVRDSGVGDVLLKGIWELPAWSADSPFIDLALEVKVPAADETVGLGTGATDAGLQLDLYQQAGSATLFATLGYRWRGRSDWFKGLRDTWWGSLGFSRPWPMEALAGDWSWGVIYDYRQAPTALSAETQELLPFLSWSPDQRWSLMGYLSYGFTRDSADESVGLQLSWQW